mgnify:CR=1 FL=1
MPYANWFPERAAGGFPRRDGTIDFYTRVNALLTPSSVVLDFGAGRGLVADIPNEYPRRLATLRGKVAEVIAADIDPIVLENPISDRQLVLAPDGRAPQLADHSVDLIVADNVFEHLTDPSTVVTELGRLLRPGGWLCARTTNRHGFIATGARLVPNRLHAAVVGLVQPGSVRREGDVFPTRYRLNTRRTILAAFAPPVWRTIVLPNRPVPTYAADSSVLAVVQTAVGAIPGAAPMLHVFARRDA